MQLPNGRTVWICGAATPLLDDLGEVRAVVGAFTDITDRNHAERAVRADLKAVTRLHEVADFCSAPGRDRRECMSCILDAAIEVTGAEKGTVQLLEEAHGALRLAAARGFGRRFLDFFDTIGASDASTCGTAMRTLERVIVADVAQSGIFAGHPSRGILREEGGGCRAVDAFDQQQRQADRHDIDAFRASLESR